MSQPQINKILDLFKDFSASRIVLAANQQNPGSIQKLFRLHNCLSRKSTKSWNFSKIFSPAELFQPQINNILEISKDFFDCRTVLAANQKKILEVFKNFFACRFVLAANQQYPGISHRFFRLQSCFSRKSTISWKYPKIFSTAELSQPQINKILEVFKNFSASRIVLAANQQNPGNIHSFFACRIVLYRKSTKSWKSSETFLPADLSQPRMNKILEISKDFFACRIVLAANQQLPGNIQRLFRLQNCRICKPRKSWKYPKIFSPAELFQPQINNILEISKIFFDCRIVLAANQQYPGIFRRFFRLKNCLSRKSTKSWKYQQIFRLQNCLSRKSTIFRKNPKTFSPAELSQPQINKILELLKDFSASRIVLAANQQKSWKYSKTFSPAELSQRQINNILEFLKDFFACRVVLAANQQYPGNIKRFF